MSVIYYRTMTTLAREKNNTSRMRTYVKNKEGKRTIGFVRPYRRLPSRSLNSVSTSQNIQLSHAYLQFAGIINIANRK